MHDAGVRHYMFVDLLAGKVNVLFSALTPAHNNITCGINFETEK